MQILKRTQDSSCSAGFNLPSEVYFTGGRDIVPSWYSAKERHDDRSTNCSEPREATKSTGPRTLAGKAVVVGLNGMKHGLLSRHGGYSHAAAFTGWIR
jgi:hypothetical protein